MTKLRQLSEQIGAGLKEARLRSGMSVRGFCQKNDLETNNYYNIEVGRRTVSLTKLVALAELHNCDVVVMVVSKEWKTGKWDNVGPES